MNIHWIINPRPNCSEKNSRIGEFLRLYIQECKRDVSLRLCATVCDCVRLGVRAGVRSGVRA